MDGSETSTAITAFFRLLLPPLCAIVLRLITQTPTGANAECVQIYSILCSLQIKEKMVSPHSNHILQHKVVDITFCSWLPH